MSTTEQRMAEKPVNLITGEASSSSGGGGTMENSLIQAYANRDPRQQPQRLLPATILARFCEQAVLETIESGARDIVEAIEESDVARAFNHLAAVHFLLIDETCAAVDFVLSSSDRGRALAELLARSFLVIAMAMLRQLHDTDATAAARAAFCTTSREICCCLSTALPPPFHWVLDEVLCLLPHAASAEAVSPHYLRDMSFEGDFHVELQEIYHHYVHFHCAGRCTPPHVPSQPPFRPPSPTPHLHRTVSMALMCSFAKFGRSAAHVIASWSDAKRAFLARATADGALSDAHIMAIAVAGKTRSAEMIKAAKRAAAVVTPLSAAAVAPGTAGAGGSGGGGLGSPPLVPAERSPRGRPLAPTALDF